MFRLTLGSGAGYRIVYGRLHKNRNVRECVGKKTHTQQYFKCKKKKH